jgi:hypothetical protein
VIALSWIGRFPSVSHFVESFPCAKSPVNRAGAFSTIYKMALFVDRHAKRATLNCYHPFPCIMIDLRQPNGTPGFIQNTAGLT